VVSFTPRLLYLQGMSPSTHYRCCVGPKAGRNAVEKRNIPCLCRESNPGRPCRLTSPAACFGCDNTRRWIPVRRIRNKPRSPVTSCPSAQLPSILLHKALDRPPHLSRAFVSHGRFRVATFQPRTINLSRVQIKISNRSVLIQLQTSVH
jgi:hypothetical protein